MHLLERRVRPGTINGMGRGSFGLLWMLALVGCETHSSLLAKTNPLGDGSVVTDATADQRIADVSPTDIGVDASSTVLPCDQPGRMVASGLARPAFDVVSDARGTQYFVWVDAEDTISVANGRHDGPTDPFRHNEWRYLHLYGDHKQRRY